jgi:hypothetical protein
MKNTFDKAMSYLSSPAHIAGAVLAGATVGLHIVGAIEAYWLLLSLGSYAAGAIGAGSLFPGAPATDPMAAIPDDTKTTEEALAWLREAQGLMGKTDAAALGEPLALAEALMPHLKAMEQSGSVDPSARGTLKSTIKKYLPETVSAYAKIPQRLVDSAQQGRPTARQAFHAQMKLVSGHLREIEAAMYGKDLNALLAQGKFLQDKLGPGEFDSPH